MPEDFPSWMCIRTAKPAKLDTLYVPTYYTYVYSVPMTTSPNLFPVDGVVHRNIGSDFFVHLFVSLLVNKIL